MDKKTKVYIYTRVSTSMQVEGYSLEAQKDRLKKYADANDMIVVGEYSDEGKSGKNIKGRPDFQRMLNDIELKKDDVGYVLVFKLSRFGRNAADTLGSLQFMQDYGVDLISVEDSIDSSKDSGKLMISVLSAVAEIERENILVQTMEGRRQKARLGKWNGGFAPYGYKLVNGELIIEEDEAEAIRLIFDKFVHTDMGYSGVVSYLVKNGIKKKARQNGYLTEFSTSMVKAVLDNPVYCGKIAYGRRSNKKIEGTRNEYHVVRQQEYDISDGIHEAIISEELWKDAQIKRRNTAKKLEKKHDLEHEFILSTILKCPSCGASIYGNIKRNPQNKLNKKGEPYPTYYSYACKHRAGKNGHICSLKRSWSCKKVDDAVAEIIINLVNNPEFSKVMKTKIKTKVDTAEAEKELEVAKKSLKQYQALKDRLMLQIDSLDPFDKNFDRKYDDMQNRLEGMYERISDAEDLVSECEEKIYNIKKDKITGDNIYNYLLMFEKVYADLSDSEKKAFYSALLEEIQLYEEDLPNGQMIKSIKFKFPVFYDGKFTDTIFRDKESTVETVVLLSKLSNAPKLDINIKMSELDLTKAEAKATYEEIQEYVKKQTGLHVTHLNIAQIKRKYGIIERDNYNLPKDADSRQPNCPPDKERVIVNAFKRFKMI